MMPHHTMDHLGISALGSEFPGEEDRLARTATSDVARGLRYELELRDVVVRVMC